MGAIGHPGDIERLRMAAIELASTEGFTRSAADVSLRRLAYYSLSPLLKTAFEQVYGAPYLARMLFAEVGATPEEDLFLRVEYDGAIAAQTGKKQAGFCAISGTAARDHFDGGTARARPRRRRDLARRDEGRARCLERGEFAVERRRDAGVAEHAALLEIACPAGGGDARKLVFERTATTAIRYRALTPEELQTLSA